MPTFVLMTRLAPGSLKDSEGRQKAGRAWLEKVKTKVPDVKFIAHYAIFGPYDFMDIYEAKNDESAQRVALISRSEGAATVETWQALPYEKFLKVLDKVD
ncbi:MAG: GYD domain-containing protein [Thermoanaerobaculia bacterium]